MADVRTQMPAVRFENVQGSRLVAVGDQILTEKRSGRTDRSPNSADQPIMNHPVTFHVNGTFTMPPCCFDAESRRSAAQPLWATIL